MATKVIFLLALFAVTSSKLPQRRRCDPEQRKETPTLCSNYVNILHLDGIQTKLQEEQMMLQQRIESMEGRTRRQLESMNSSIGALEGLVTNLSSSLQGLERMKSQSEKEVREVKKQLERQEADIDSLKRDVQELAKQGERVRGNFSEIEEKLEATERQLREKNIKLENLETETEAAFNDTQRLLKVLKDELSHLNSTAKDLEVKFEARLDATEAQLEAEVKKTQNNSEAFRAKLNQQKVEVDGFKVKTERRFRNVDERLKTQKTTADQQMADIDTLKRDAAGIQNRLASTETKVVEQSKLNLEVNSLKAEVHAKVAFAATIIESSGVFTGPQTHNMSNILIFNRVFTNIGNAYNRKTGIFTAPLKGVYHFSFMTFGYNGHTSGAILVKNGHYQVSTWEFKGPDASDSTSTTVILELNVKDTVNIILWEGGKIHTSVFSGFLIFPTS